MGLTELESVTSCVSSRRSNQLSYKPVKSNRTTNEREPKNPAARVGDSVRVATAPNIQIAIYDRRAAWSHGLIALSLVAPQCTACIYPSGNVRAHLSPK